MGDMVKQPGRLRPAPENFLSEEQVKAVGSGRRDFLRKSFLAAGAALAAPMAARAASEGDINILGVDHLAGHASRYQPVRHAVEV